MRHPKNSKRSGGTRWQPPPKTGDALEKAVEVERKIADEEFAEYEKRWYKSCEETHVRD